MKILLKLCLIITCGVAYVHLLISELSAASNYDELFFINNIEISINYKNSRRGIKLEAIKQVEHKAFRLLLRVWGIKILNQ